MMQHCRALALTSVMSKWDAMCGMERAREPEGWEQLHVGGMCQLFDIKY